MLSKIEMELRYLKTIRLICDCPFALNGRLKHCFMLTRSGPTREEKNSSTGPCVAKKDLLCGGQPVLKVTPNELKNS